MPFTAQDFIDVDQDLDDIKAFVNTAAATIVTREGSTIPSVKGVADALAGVAIADTVSGVASLALVSIADNVSAVDAAEAAALVDIEARRNTVSGDAVVAQGSMTDAVGVVEAARDGATATIDAASDSVTAEQGAFSAALADKSEEVTLEAAAVLNSISHVEESLKEVMADDLEQWSFDIAADSQDIVNSVHTEIFDKIADAQAKIDTFTTAAKVDAQDSAPFRKYDTEAEMSADVSPVPDIIAIVKGNASLYIKTGAAGAAGWDQFTGAGSLMSKARSDDFGVVHDAYSGSPSNQFDKLELMCDAAIAAGHGIVQIDPPQTALQALLCNGRSNKFRQVKWEVHPDAIIHGTNDIPWRCQKINKIENYLPAVTRTSVAGGAATNWANYAHQPDGVTAFGKQYVSYHWNDNSNDESKAGQVLQMKRLLSNGTLELLGSPWYYGPTADNPWDPALNDERMWQGKFAFWDSRRFGGQDKLIFRQVCGRTSANNGMLISTLLSEGGSWHNQFLWFPDDPDLDPVVTDDLTAPPDHSHRITIDGNEYFPYAPGGNLITDQGRICIFLTLSPPSGSLNNQSKIHRVLYSDDGGNAWKLGPAVPYGDIEPHQAWEMRGCRVVLPDGRVIYIAYNRTNTKDGTVTEHKGRRHAVSYSLDGVHWTAWALVASEMPLETVCPVPANGTHLLYPGAVGIRRTAQSLNMDRYPFTGAISPGPRLSNEARRETLEFRYTPKDILDTAFICDFDVIGEAGRLRGRGFDNQWTVIPETVSNYIVDPVTDGVDYLAGPPTNFKWLEYSEDRGELAAVSVAWIDYDTGKIYVIWSQNRQQDDQQGGTEIVMAEISELPKPDRVNICPTDASEIRRNEDNHGFVADLNNNNTTLIGSGFAGVDMPREGQWQFHIPFQLQSSPAANDPAVIAYMGNVEKHAVVEIDNDGGRPYRRTRVASSYDGVGQRGRSRVVTNKYMRGGFSEKSVFSGRIDHATGWVTLTDRHRVNIGSPLRMSLGDGFQTSDAVAGRQLIFDLAAATFEKMPDGFLGAETPLTDGFAPNLFTDIYLRNPIEKNQRVRLRPGKFFLPNWYCESDGGADAYARVKVEDIAIANEDSGGDRRYIQISLDTLGTGNLIIQHVWEGADALTGVPHTFQAQFRDRDSDFTSREDLELFVDFLIYPDGNRYAPQVATFLSRRMGRDWEDIDGVLPIPQWQESEAKPFSIENASAAMQFIIPAEKIFSFNLRWFDLHAGIKKREFVLPQPVDQQHRLDRVIQVLDVSQINGVLLEGGHINPNGDGTYRLRASRELRDKMRTAPDLRTIGRFAAQGLKDSTLVTEEFVPTLAQSEDDMVMIGCDTLTLTGWSGMDRADVVASATADETIFGAGGSRVRRLEEIATDDPDDLRFWKYSAGGSIELTEGDSISYYPPGEPLQDGPFVGDGVSKEFTTTLELGSKSGLDVAIHDPSDGGEVLLGFDEFDAIAGDPNGSISLVTALSSTDLMHVVDRGTRDTYANVNALDNIGGADTLIVEDKTRSKSMMILEAYPRFYGMIDAKTQAWVDSMALTPIGQLQEVMDRCVSRAVASNLWDRLQGLWILGLHNGDDTRVNAVAGGPTASFVGAYEWRRHYGFIGKGASDGNISTNLTPDGTGAYKQDDASAFVFAQKMSAGASHYLMGAGGNFIRFAPDLGGNTQHGFNTAQATGTQRMFASLDVPAFSMLSRDNAANYNIFTRSGFTRQFRSFQVAEVSTGLPSGQLFLNRMGSSYGQHEILAAGIGGSYTRAEAQRWSQLLFDLQADLEAVPYFDR